MIAPRLDETWCVLYSVLKVIEDRQLYRKVYRCGRKGEFDEYATFQEFWDAKVKLPFERWKELEDTYPYGHRYATWLFVASYEEVRNVSLFGEGALEWRR
jgi:hypothetical protein